MEQDLPLYSSDSFESQKRRNRIIKSLKWIIILLVLFFCVYSFYKNTLPPKDFPTGEIIKVKSGSSLRAISKDLYDNHVISSPFIFQTFAIILGGDKNINAGEYQFDSPVTVFVVAGRIQAGIYGIPSIKVTLPEGMTRREMSVAIASMLPHFNKDNFMKLTENDEGYLFPDTYFFFKNYTEVDVIKILKDNFNKKIDNLSNKIKSSGKTLKDIVIMASIIEKESNGDDDRVAISSILWKRIENKMPLQVDATFLFLIGKESSELTRADLGLKSPYNTYINKGLPPGPISNPGIETLTAAMSPVKTQYLFYLHDKDGVVHYAKTFEEHKKNKQKYL
jgi:UPF0755 protein